MAYVKRDIIDTMTAPLEMRQQNFGNQAIISNENAVARNHTTSMPLESKAASSPRATVVTSTVGLIRVHGYTPGEGEQGVPITANISFEYYVEPTVCVRLVVGRRAIATQVRELADPSHGKWQVEGTVPPPVRQQPASPKVLLTVQAVGADNIILDSVTFGEFTYWESGEPIC